jgi:hypothetical protein
MPELTLWGEEGENQQGYWPHPLDHEWDSPSYDTVRTASPAQCLPRALTPVGLDGDGCTNYTSGQEET